MAFQAKCHWKLLQSKCMGKQRGACVTLSLKESKAAVEESKPLVSESKPPIERETAQKPAAGCINLSQQKVARRRT
eukprot:828185-Amphidinium_carterae.2